MKKAVMVVVDVFAVLWILFWAYINPDFLLIIASPPSILWLGYSMYTRYKPAALTTTNSSIIVIATIALSLPVLFLLYIFSL